MDVAPDPSPADQMAHNQVEGVQNGSDDFNLRPVDPDSLPKKRPWSAQGIQSALSPSPTFIETRRHSKDDTHVFPGPVTPKRPNHPPRGLSLQMPPRDLSSTSTANLAKRIPISPKPDLTTIYPSLLPRRTRGMDFSRAATSLHHSTLAEQSSPESSPVAGGRRGMIIPPRRGIFNPPGSINVPESPGQMSNSLWITTMNPERSGLASSVGSSILIEGESSNSSDGDELMDLGDDDGAVQMTPHIDNNGITLMNPFASGASSPGGDGVGVYSPAAQKLMSYQRARLQSRRSRTRKSSSSASGHSSMHSPAPQSPPVLRSIETNLSMNGSFLLDEPAKREIESRRESLSLGTNEMQLSDAEQSDDGGNLPFHSNIDFHEDAPIATPVTPSMEDRKHVVRRAVTRRGNLLPKSKGFARVRAALQEEGAPVDTEVRREAEVVRQVRDVDLDLTLHSSASAPTTTASSPNVGLGPAEPAEISEPTFEQTSANSEDLMRRRSSETFTNHAARHGGGVTFWNNFDDRMRTPPPPMVPRSSSSAISEDTNMETPQQHGIKITHSHDSNSSACQTRTTTFEMAAPKGNKRLREDDLDPNYFKRRAVSPGLSVQNSPVLPQSPGWWGTPKSSRELSTVPGGGDRVSSNGSNGSVNSTPGPPKRVGVQGLIDTNDGLMNMSIE